jgi:hypothetical protein
MSISRAARLMTAAVALAIGGLALPGNASAGFNVADFSCGSTPFSVNVDVRGLGSTDVCVTSSATVDLSCACVNKSGSCPQAANKATTPTTIQSAATIEPKNGRVHTTVNLPFSPTDASCTAPEGCGSGQTVKLIEFTTQDSQPTFTLFQGPCGSTTGTLAGPLNCGPTSAQPFPGKSGSCLALFP